ncbi:MAG: hypothetical protein H0S84_03205 [Bacteroidales bacterium]|jgi:hypothetical protein|nr:hypothetical protein [Bacteroidales bacterium]
MEPAMEQKQKFETAAKAFLLFQFVNGKKSRLTRLLFEQDKNIYLILQMALSEITVLSRCKTLSKSDKQFIEALADLASNAADLLYFESATKISFEYLLQQ